MFAAEQEPVKYTVVVPYKTWEGTNEVELLADYIYEGDNLLTFYVKGQKNMTFNNRGGWLSYYKTYEE